MLNPIQERLLAQHYMRMFEPLTDCTVATRTNTASGYPELHILRMLARRPDGGLMQVLATLGASVTRLPRRKGVPAQRNEYVTFLPADWNLDDPRHRWVMDMLADIADFAAEERVDIYYADTLDLRKGSSISRADEDVNMTHCLLLPPLNREDEDVATCRTGLFSRANIIHVMPITEAEMSLDRLTLRNRFYPESGEACYLCARSR